MPDDQEMPKKPGFHPRDVMPSADPRDTADLFVGGPAKHMLGRMAAFYRGFRHDGVSIFDGVTVIVPPGLVWEASEKDIGRMLTDGFEAVWEEIPKGMVSQIALKDVVIHRCQCLASSEVIAALKAAGTKRIFLIPEVSKYRDDVPDPEHKLGMSGTLLPEDFWVPHVVRLATTSLAVANGQACAMVFHSADVILKAENRKHLEDVEGLYPLFVNYDGEETNRESATQQIPRWVAMAVSGRSADALAELAASGLGPDDQRQARLNIAVRVRNRVEVTQLVHEYLDEGVGLEPENGAWLGHIAHQFGDDVAARVLLESAIGRLTDHRTLTLALHTVTSMGDQQLLQQCWTRLSALFPNALVLAENREHRLFLMCELVHDNGTPPPSRAGFGPSDSYLADALYQCSGVDYNALLAHVRETWPDSEPLAALCVALHALSIRDLGSALMAATFAAQDVRYSERAALILLDALRRIFLEELQPEDDMEVYKLPLWVICNYLAEHSHAAHMRAELTEVLDVETAGMTGLAVLAAFALEVIGAGAPMPEQTVPTQRSNDEVFERFVQMAFQWMSEQPAIEAGVTRLPPELLIDEPQRLIAALERVMHFATRMDGDARELQALERFAFLICLLGPFVPDTTADLTALRQLAAKSWLHGRAQHARNLAEQILSIAGEAPTRRRIAWMSYADILHHTGSPVDALVGLACAAMTGAQMTAADLYQEAYVLLRVARDLGLYGVARSVLSTCRHLSEIEGAGEHGRQRLVGIELSLDVARASDLGSEELFQLLERTRAHCAEVLDGGDEVFSAAAHFLQIAGEIERGGRALPAAAVALREALRSQNVGGLLHAVSAAFPTPEDVVDLHNRIQAARYSLDTAADQRAIVVAAHRLLLPQVPEVSAQQAAVAVELLSERSIRGGSEHRLAPSWPAEFASEISRNGMLVLLLGLDSEGELAGALVSEGVAEVVRPAVQQRSFSSRLSAWSADYPYKYGLINRDAGNVEFYSSMEKLGLALPKAERLLVVAQPALQQIPFNLALVSGEFAGMTSAIGSAPSLTWLRDVHSRPRTDASRRVAWISCEPEVAAYRTLEMLYARLSPVFEQHGFEIDTSGGVPEDIRGASLAVVTAHGQLTAENRFIRRIADEQEFLESPLTLARTLAGVELVILFVCSGGRVDRHPFANTTVSLPKMLLDRGCRTVVASPWPLDSVVPGNWLERFLDAWEAGETVLDANFQANRYVSERLGPEATLCLAMSVYGDVLLRNPIRRAPVVGEPT